VIRCSRSEETPTSSGLAAGTDDAALRGGINSVRDNRSLAAVLITRRRLPGVRIIISQSVAEIERKI
jgi:hypothetical protein